MLRGRRRCLFTLRASTAAAAILWVTLPAGAETLEQALVQSYQNNPQLNAQRAAARATDENVSIALGGYRPRLTATSSLSEVYLENVARGVGNRTTGENAVTTFGSAGTQTLFNVF